jgi:hypothetical protein
MQRQTERLMLLCAVAALAACKQLPQIPITTPKPLEVNLNMRLDVYQYRGDEPQDKEAIKSAGEATERMRNRMQEIQTLKNNQFVGEDHRGLLQIREVPAGDWGVQVKKAVAAENEDRMLLMRQKAKNANRPLHELEDEQWHLRTEQADTGEWIEVTGTTAGSFQWKRVTTDTPPPAPPPVITTPVPTPAQPKP